MKSLEDLQKENLEIRNEIARHQLAKIEAEPEVARMIIERREADIKKRNFEDFLLWVILMTAMVWWIWWLFRFFTRIFGE